MGSDTTSHDARDEQEPVTPVELGRVLEVHPENAGDERRDDEDRAPRRQLLHRAVQAVRDDGELGVAEVGEHVALGLEQLGDPEDVVAEVLEVDEGGVAHGRGLAAQDRGDDLAQRRRVAPELDDRLAEVEELAGAPAPDRRDVVGAVVEHVALGGVEAVVDRVGHHEVAVDDDVEQGPEQETLVRRVVLLELGLEALADGVDRERSEGVGVIAVRALTDRQQPTFAEDDVDLAGDELPSR